MIVGLLTMSLSIPASHSLKDKRRVLARLKSRLAKDFNISVSEVGDQDIWQQAQLAVVHVGVSRPVVDAVLAHVVRYCEQYHECIILNYETEFLT